MNPGQFNEFMGELRAFTRDQGRIIDLLTQIAAQTKAQQQTVGGGGEMTMNMITEKILADFHMGLMAADLTVDDPAGAFREAEDKRAVDAVLTPDKPRTIARDKPKATKKAK